MTKQYLVLTAMKGVEKQPFGIFTLSCSDFIFSGHCSIGGVVGVGDPK
jgi:hypothetical protein